MAEETEAIAPFDSLPDEIVLAIIEKAVEDQRNKHNLLINLIGNISVRFRRLAADPSFWKGDINIRLWGSEEGEVQAMERQLHMVIGEFLGTGVERLQIKTGDNMTYCGNKPLITPVQDFTLLAERCLKLTDLNFTGFKIESWPNTWRNWDSVFHSWPVEKLSLAYVTMSSKAFKNVPLHFTLPNIRVFEMNSCNFVGTHPIKLPDMSRCEKLEEVQLHDSAVMPANTAQGNSVPFPRNLKTLKVINGTHYKFNTDLLKMCLKNCDVDIGLGGTTWLFD